jgi:predicted amidohydrolase YtcJ
MKNRIWMICVLIGLFSAAPAPTGQQPPVDLVVVNAKVLTVDPKNTQAEAVAIRGNTFAAIGTTAEIRKMAGPQTRVIDAGGRTVVPGFIESHVHATGAARGEVSQVFIQLHSIQEIKDWVRARAKEAGAGGWVRLPRVDVTRIKEGRLPNKADLDEAAPNNPAVYTWQYANKNVQILNDSRVHGQDGKLPVAAEPSGTAGDRDPVSGQPGRLDEEVQRGRHHQHHRTQQQRGRLPELSAVENAGPPSAARPRHDPRRHG